MKYYLLFLLLIVGCSADPGMPKETGPQATGPTNTGTVLHFKYKEHDYIQFGQGNYQCIVHDPDCKLERPEKTEKK